MPGAAGLRRARGRRWLRWMRRACYAVVALAAALLAALLLLMLLTPSVGNAEAIARADARLHHSVFPGPAVPRRYSEALIATEDHRFASEPGVDVFAIARVALGRITGRGDQGGATLYQQLAKLLYTPGQGGLRVEAEQVALAIKLKFSYSEAQILTMYADVAYFGHGYYGLPAASCGYFGVPPARLSWPRAAVLAGLVQAPSAYDPLEHPALARAREEHVVARLVATGKLTARQAAAVLAVPMRRMLRHAGGCPA